MEKCSNVVMKRHVDTGATDKTTFEPWRILSRDDVASSAARRSVIGTQTKGKQTGYYSQLKGRQCSAPKCKTPQQHGSTTECPEHSHFFYRWHPFGSIVVHMTPFSTSVFPAASPVYQQCTRIRSFGSNIKKDNDTRRNTRDRAHCVNDDFRFQHPSSSRRPQLKDELFWHRHHCCRCQHTTALASRWSATLPLLCERSPTGLLSHASRCTHSQMIKSALFTTLTTLCDLSRSWSRFCFLL